MTRAGRYRTSTPCRPPTRSPSRTSCSARCCANTSASRPGMRPRWGPEAHRPAGCWGMRQMPSRPAAATPCWCAPARTVPPDSRAAPRRRPPTPPSPPTSPPSCEAPTGPSPPPVHARVARRHMHEFGSPPEHLAAVAVTSRRHASLHPNAQMRSPLTLADVAASKPIADPLRLLDCCLISDAGGAFIVTARERAKDCAQAPVYLAGIGEAHTHEHLICADSLTEFGVRQSGQIAYRMAGLGPRDIDLAQLYDSFSIVPIRELEALGFCGRGEGGAFYAAGHAALDGTLPVNTHGGMLSHAHAGAAGGLFGIVEAVRQLRGGLGERQVADARVALVHNEGGILSSHCTAIFSNTPD